MRLINVDTLRLETIYGHPEHPYVALSHTWGHEEDELTFQDMLSLEGDMSRTSKVHASKIVHCCTKAKQDGYKYAWIDTCCIDKSNSVELYEAINSMYRWYDRASICYAYITDMAPGDPISKLATCRWFERGWTLQELLASKKIDFFDSGWGHLGNKRSLSATIESATGIPGPFLAGVASVMNEASIAQRMSWASKRHTTRPEDVAYCLLGIFDVMIPLIYGEGAEAAFLRLQEAIMKKDGDDSILSWALYPPDTLDESTRKEIPGGALAFSPYVFRHCRDVVRRKDRGTVIKAFEIFGGSMPIILHLHEGIDKEVYGILGCGPELEKSIVVAIPLQRNWASTSNASPISTAAPEHKEYVRPHGKPAILMEKPHLSANALELIHIKTERLTSTGTTLNRRHWIYLQEPYPRGLDLIDVLPRKSWIKDNAMIRTPNDGRYAKTVFLARFRATSENCSDFVVGIMYVYGEPRPTIQGNLAKCSRSTSMDDVAKSYRHLSAAEWKLTHAKSGSLNLVVDLAAQSVASQDMFVVRWGVTDKEPLEMIDITLVGEVMNKRIELLSLMGQDSSAAARSDNTKRKLEIARRKLGSVETKLSDIESKITALMETKSDLERNYFQLKTVVENCLNEDKEATLRATELLQSQQKLKDDIRQLLDRTSGSLPGGHGAETEQDSQMLLSVIIGLMSRGDETPLPPTLPLLPLTWASRVGHVHIVRMLLGMRKNVPALEHELPDALICAAKGDHMEIVTLLLEAGVSIKPCEKDRTTEAMFELASNGGHAELLGLLVHRYCMGTTSHFHHDKVLNWAAEKGYALVVETLLQMWITHTDDHLHNALCVAALHGHENVAKALLNAVQPATAAKTSTNDLPKLPPVSSTDTGERLHAASGSRGQPIPSPLESHELRGPWIEPCPQRKKIIDGFSISGLELNALQIAARKGHLSTCSLLLDAGADANAFRSTQMSGCLPINQALEGGHFEVAKLLLERGANPDGRVPFTIPFAVAIRKGIQELIYLLVAKGARLNMDEEVTYIQRGGFLSRRPKVKHSTLFAFAKEFGPDWAVDFLKDMNYLSLTDRKRTANRWLEQHGHEGADAEGNESNKRYSGHSMQSCKIHYEQPGQNSGPCSPIAPPPSPSPPLYPAVLSPELLASTDSQLTDSSNSLCLLTLDGADFRKSEETIKDASSSIIVKELI